MIMKQKNDNECGGNRDLISPPAPTTRKAQEQDTTRTVRLQNRCMGARREEHAPPPTPPPAHAATPKPLRVVGRGHRAAPTLALSPSPGRRAHPQRRLGGRAHGLVRAVLVLDRRLVAHGANLGRRLQKRGQGGSGGEVSHSAAALMHSAAPVRHAKLTPPILAVPSAAASARTAQVLVPHAPRGPCPVRGCPPRRPRRGCTCAPSRSTCAGRGPTPPATAAPPTFGWSSACPSCPSKSLHGGVGGGGTRGQGKQSQGVGRQRARLV